MKLSRRFFLSGVCVAALLSPALAWVHGNAIPIGTGWNTLPLGCGGLVTGLHIANDGSMVCRTDVGNIYRWSGNSSGYADPSNRWVPLLTFASLGSSAVSAGYYGAWEHVLAPGNSSVHLSIFADMANTTRKSWIWYSTNSGATWTKSNIAFTWASIDAGTSADSNASAYKTCNYKIVIDPANENVAYCGMPLSSGNSAGVYTTLNQVGGSTLATWTSVKPDGVTPVGAIANSVSCGLAIDASSGTTTVGGQTVTNRIILPVGGVGIYESTDGGVTFTEIAASAFGTADFFVPSGGFTAEGVYYCVVVHATAGGIWRYASSTWTKISTPLPYAASTYSRTTFLIIDPRNNATSKAYLSVSGPNGIGAGYTSTDANTGAPPTWGGRTGGQNPALKAQSFDIGYLNYIFGQQDALKYTNATNAVVDSNGVCFWGGNQSLWYFGTSGSDPSPSGTPNYGSSANTYSWSLGRGMEATVAQDILCPPGGTYPVLALQDIGAPARGTFVTYPQDIAIHFLEYTCSNLEYAANDPSFIVACATGQQGVANVTAYRYSTSYGSNGSWTAIAGTPDTLWNGGGAALYGGQLVAVDSNHWMAVPSGFGGNYQPAYTANAMSAASWSYCTGLPTARWLLRGWANGPTSKPFAVGYGTDLGTVWACLVVSGSSTATLYRSTDSGANFSSVATWTISVNAVGVYCLAVPDNPDELWITGSYTGGTSTSLWHVTGARTAGTPTLTAVTLPANAALPIAFTLGAPATPGGYPTLYLLGWASFGATQYLYRGSWNGSSVTWSLVGSTGTRQDLPISCQVCGIQSIRGDWNVYGRLYVSSNQSGFAYYNP